MPGCHRARLPLLFSCSSLASPYERRRTIRFPTTPPPPIRCKDLAPAPQAGQPRTSPVETQPTRPRQKHMKTSTTFCTSQGSTQHHQQKLAWRRGVLLPFDFFDSIACPNPRRTITCIPPNTATSHITQHHITSHLKNKTKRQDDRSHAHSFHICAKIDRTSHVRPSTAQHLLHLPSRAAHAERYSVHGQREASAVR